MDVKEENGTWSGDENVRYFPMSNLVSSNPKSTRIFDRQPEELDSAIRSISCEQVSDVAETMVDMVCDVQQPQLLNQREIQSAVDSIL